MRNLVPILAAALIAVTVTAAPPPATASAAAAGAAVAAAVRSQAASVGAVAATAATVPAPSAPVLSSVKIAIIVGATDAWTPMFRGFANNVYNEAIKWSNNVIRVYSPSATWPRVKAAVNGASIIVYIGHGNGYPSPYGFNPLYTYQDGFGLNYDTNGDGKYTDYERRYYGEPSIRTLKPAPGAIVLLYHLCYAAGNPEMGGPDPTLSVARQRADNFASAFLAAGAKAVLAITHGDDPYYIRALFTTKQTLTDYWRNAPGFNNHVISFPSVRTPGALEMLDPDTTKPTGFFRAYTGSTTARTEQVTGAPFASTAGDPTTMQVPGKATPVADGTPVYGTPADAVNGVNPTTTIPASTVLSVNSVESVKSAVDGSPIYLVSGGGGLAGWMPGSSLSPRDSLPPRVWEVLDGTGTFSPDGNGVGDTMPISVRLSEAATWTLTVRDGWGNPLASATGTGSTASINWAPTPASVSDGAYTWSLQATDPLGNGPLQATGHVVVDRSVPVLTAAGTPAVPLYVTPNGDGSRDTLALAIASTKTGTAIATIRNSHGDIVATPDTALPWKTGSIIWDGRSTGGTLVPDGFYDLQVVTTDDAGNPSAPQSRIVAVYGAPGFVTSTPAIFFPQDGDTLAATSKLGFRLLAPATVTWTILNAAGVPVRTIKTGEALAAGTYAFVWNGRNDLGAYVPRGTYRSSVIAGDGTLLFTQQSVVIADAFKIVSSTATPARLTRITITTTSAEALATAPRLTLTQPGRPAWSVAMTRVSIGVYRVTVTLRSSATGSLRLKVAATDAKGQVQASTLVLPLH